jgi:hypothetical protein
MGYYTSHALTILEGDNSLIQKFREENEEAFHAFDEDGNSEGITKWYDSDEDLINFSKKHPEALFMLEGDGEENGDLWKLYVQNGKFQRCGAKVTFDEYDVTKMQTLNSIP